MIERFLHWWCDWFHTGVVNWRLTAYGARYECRECLRVVDVRLESNDQRVVERRME